MAPLISSLEFGMCAEHPQQGKAKTTRNAVENQELQANRLGLTLLFFLLFSAPLRLCAMRGLAWLLSSTRLLEIETPIAGEGCECSTFDGSSYLCHQSNQEAQVVYGGQPVEREFACSTQVPEIGAGMCLAREAIA